MSSRRDEMCWRRGWSAAGRSSPRASAFSLGHAVLRGSFGPWPHRARLSTCLLLRQIWFLRAVRAGGLEGPGGRLRCAADCTAVNSAASTRHLLRSTRVTSTLLFVPVLVHLGCSGFTCCNRCSGNSLLFHSHSWDPLVFWKCPTAVESTFPSPVCVPTSASLLPLALIH